MQDHKIKYPWGNADKQTLVDAATMTQQITNTLTILQRLTGFGQAVTGLSLQAAPDLPIGSQVKVDILQGATGRNVTFGSAGSTIVAPALTGDANDRDEIILTWDGSSFVADGPWAKILAA
jgi:hypothetical protein